MGIKFENIRTGEVVVLERSAQIAAFLNSSDLSPNASKGQDYKWRLGVEIISQIDDIRKDVRLMQSIAQEKGMLVQDLSTHDLLYYIVQQQQAAKDLELEAAESNPEYEESYEARIREARKAKVKVEAPKVEAPAETPVTSKAVKSSTPKAKK